MKTSLRLLLLVLIAGCTTLQTSSPPSSYELGAVSEAYTTNELAQEAIDCAPSSRTPANAKMCARAFEVDLNVKIRESVLLRKARKDVEEIPDVAPPTREQVEKTVSLTDPMKLFRERYLRFFMPSYTGREPLIRSFEASLRMRSQAVEDRLATEPAYRNYDVVIYGAGVHAIIALHEVLRNHPNAKILMIDEGDTAGATFRYGKDFFNINSSNRASGGDSLPLPGQGNLNELAGLPIQVSDMTAVKYPSANDLGSALVTGLFAALQAHPNVDVVFNSTVKKVEKGQTNTSSKTQIQRKDGSLIEVEGSVVLVTTGLGRPKLPEKLKAQLIAKPELQAQASPDRLPKVVTFEDLVRIISQSNDPRKFFAGKRFGVVGKGDSANVAIEYALGLATRDAYANSNAQSGRPEKIVWIGQDAKTCQEFSSQARSRYVQIAKGFETSDANFSALLEAAPPQLTNVNIRNDGKLDALLEGRENVSDLDFIIVTTGAERNVRELFGPTLLAGRTVRTNTTDDVFLASPELFSVTTAQTRVSRGVRTKVSIKHNDAEIYVLGTAAGNLTVQAELVGVLQNSVSIFNNAPRVVAATRAAMQTMKPRHVSARMRLVVSDPAKAQTIRVNGIGPSRLMPSQTVNYLRSVFQEALLYMHSPRGGEMRLTLELDPAGDVVVRSANSNDISHIVKLLTQTREFFSLSRELLSLSPGKLLSFYSKPDASGRYTIEAGKLSLVANEGGARSNPQSVVTNANLMLRGVLEQPKVTAASSSKPVAPNSAVSQVQPSAPNVSALKNPNSDIIRKPLRGDVFPVKRNEIDFNSRPFEPVGAKGTGNIAVTSIEVDPVTGAKELFIYGAQFQPDSVKITSPRNGATVERTEFGAARLVTYRISKGGAALNVKDADGRVFETDISTEFQIFKQVSGPPTEVSKVTPPVAVLKNQYSDKIKGPLFGTFLQKSSTTDFTGVRFASIALNESVKATIRPVALEGGATVAKEVVFDIVFSSELIYVNPVVKSSEIGRVGRAEFGASRLAEYRFSRGKETLNVKDSVGRVFESDITTDYQIFKQIEGPPAEGSAVAPPLTALKNTNSDITRKPLRGGDVFPLKRYETDFNSRPFESINDQGTTRTAITSVEVNPETGANDAFFYGAQFQPDLVTITYPTNKVSTTIGRNEFGAARLVSYRLSKGGVALNVRDTDGRVFETDISSEFQIFKQVSGPSIAVQVAAPAASSAALNSNASLKNQFADTVRKSLFQSSFPLKPKSVEFSDKSFKPIDLYGSSVTIIDPIVNYSSNSQSGQVFYRLTFTSYTMVIKAPSPEGTTVVSSAELGAAPFVGYRFSKDRQTLNIKDYQGRVFESDISTEFQVFRQIEGRPAQPKESSVVFRSKEDLEDFPTYTDVTNAKSVLIYIKRTVALRGKNGKLTDTFDVARGTVPVVTNLPADFRFESYGLSKDLNRIRLVEARAARVFETSTQGDLKVWTQVPTTKEKKADKANADGKAGTSAKVESAGELAITRQFESFTSVPTQGGAGPVFGLSIYRSSIVKDLNVSPMTVFAPKVPIMKFARSIDQKCIRVQLADGSVFEARKESNFTRFFEVTPEVNQRAGPGELDTARSVDRTVEKVDGDFAVRYGIDNSVLTIKSERHPGKEVRNNLPDMKIRGLVLYDDNSKLRIVSEENQVYESDRSTLFAKFKNVGVMLPPLSAAPRKTKFKEFDVELPYAQFFDRPPDGLSLSSIIKVTLTKSGIRVRRGQIKLVTNFDSRPISTYRFSKSKVGETVLQVTVGDKYFEAFEKDEFTEFTQIQRPNDL